MWREKFAQRPSRSCNKMFTRRTLLGGAIAAGFSRAAGGRLRIGITDWNLKLTADPESVPLASRLGFEGVQVSFGRKIVDDRMPADDPAIVARYMKLSADHRLPIDGTCVDMLHTNGLKNDKLAIKWVVDAIRLTATLETDVLLLPFFGRQAMKTDEERNYVGDVLRELAPEAQKAGVILGLEDENSAEENVRVMDRSRAGNVLVYYDVGNSTNIGGYDVVKEVRWLGKDRICQFHLKDKPLYMGEGRIPFADVLKAIGDIGFTGYANLETDFRPGSLDEDMRRNLNYVRKLLT
jgi:L-ribulose-5-phosphate 3-epimerase